MDTNHIELREVGPPHVDADWRAFCQAIYRGIEGQEWEALYHHYRELNQVAGAKKPSESQKVKALWAMKAKIFLIQLAKKIF